MPSSMRKLARSTSRHAVRIGAAAVLLTVPLAGAAVAAPSDDQSGANASGRYCVEVYGQATTSGRVSPLQYRHCSNKSRSDARASLSSAEARQAIGAKAAASTLLMTWFADRDYRGASTDVYGSAGPCDTAGYKLTLSWTWSGRISSAGGTTACNIARFYNGAKTFAESQILPTPYLGSRLNDNVSMIQVYRRG